MSQQSGINQFHVAQFLPIRKNMRCCAARHIYSAARRLMFAGSTEVYLPYIFTNICFSTHASTQCTQPTPQTIRSRRYDAALGTVEEKGSGEGGADEDGDDFDWIQMLVCSLVLLQCTSICFHLVRCFYRLTDWTGLLFFFSSKLSLCDGALGSDYCQRPQQVPAHPTETRTNMLLLKHESKQTVCSVKMIHSCEFTLTTKTKEIMYGAESPAVTCWGNKLRLCFVFKPSFVGFLIGWDKFTDLLLVSSQSSLSKDVQEQDQHQTATTEVRLRMWMSEGCNGENGGGWECESTPVWVFLKRRQNKRTVPLTDKMSSRVNHWAASWGNELWCEPCFRQKKDGVRETGIKWENKVFRGKENNGAESDKGRKMASCKDKQMEKDWIRWPEHWVSVIQTYHRHVHDPFFMYDADQSI